jgi:hypothetical protein
MMLTDRKEEQETLFKEIIYKKLNVREAEGIARRIAFERARKLVDPELVDIEEKLKESLGTRVRIEKKEEGGKITIDYFSQDDLHALFAMLTSKPTNRNADEMLHKFIAQKEAEGQTVENTLPLSEEEKVVMNDGEENPMEKPPEPVPADDATDEELYSIKDFTV